MNEKVLKVNNKAVFLCILIGLLIQAIWAYYLNETWLQLRGLTIREMNENFSPVPYLYAFLNYLIVFNFMAWLFSRIPVESGIKGLGLGFLLASCFYLTTLISQHAFAMYSMSLSLIEGGYILLSWMIGGFLLGAWRKYDEVPTQIVW